MYSRHSRGFLATSVFSRARPRASCSSSAIFGRCTWKPSSVTPSALSKRNGVRLRGWSASDVDCRREISGWHSSAVTLVRFTEPNQPAVRFLSRYTSGLRVALGDEPLKGGTAHLRAALSNRRAWALWMTGSRNIIVRNGLTPRAARSASSTLAARDLARILASRASAAADCPAAGLWLAPVNS